MGYPRQNPIPTRGETGPKGLIPSHTIPYRFGAYDRGSERSELLGIPQRKGAESN